MYIKTLTIQGFKSCKALSLSLHFVSNSCIQTVTRHKSNPFHQDTMSLWGETVQGRAISLLVSSKPVFLFGWESNNKCATAIRFVLSDAYTSMSREERQALLHEGVSATTTLSAFGS